MLELIRRCPAFVEGYRAYCQEAWDSHIPYFVPTNPARIDNTWFERTRDWYDKKETGAIAGQPTGFHYWAADGGRFIGEFQLRTQLAPDVMNGIGSIGYAVRVSEQDKGYGTAILREGLKLAKAHGMQRVLLNINAHNTLSCSICEKLGGKLMDEIPASNPHEGEHLLRRYWIDLEGSDD